MNKANIYSNSQLESESKVEDKFAWVYLINLGFYLIPLFVQSKPTWQIATSLITLIPFIYCYFWAYRAPRKEAYKPILTMIAIGIAITPINTGSLSLFTFAGFFIGFNYSLRQAFYCLLGLAAMLALMCSLLDLHYYFLIYGSALIAGIGLFGIAERKRLSAKLAEHRSQQEITQLATMLERERIARDLHDIMGHSLSSISLKAELAQKLVAKNKLEQANAELQELNTIARDSLSQIRQTVSGYKHKGLSSSVTYLCQALRDKGMSVTLKGDIPQLNPDVETHLILSLTELCNNIIRHSSASHCDIVFADTEGALSITVTDDASIATLSEGNGLTGIRERLAQFGGTLDYQLDTNTHFTLILPRQGKA